MVNIDGTVIGGIRTIEAQSLVEAPQHRSQVVKVGMSLWELVRLEDNADNNMNYRVPFAYHGVN